MCVDTSFSGAVIAPDGNLESVGRYFDDPLYFVDVKMLGLAFRVDGKILYKARKIVRCKTERCRNLRAREFGSRFRSQFVK